VHELRLLALFFLGSFTVVELKGADLTALQIALALVSGLALLELACQLGGARRWWAPVVLWVLFSLEFGYLGTITICHHSVACDVPGMNYLAKLWPPYALIGAIVFGVALASVALLRWKGVRSRWPAFLLGAFVIIASRILAERIVDPWRW